MFIVCSKITSKSSCPACSAGRQSRALYFVLPAPLTRTLHSRTTTAHGNCSDCASPTACEVSSVRVWRRLSITFIEDNRAGPAHGYIVTRHQTNSSYLPRSRGSATRPTRNTRPRRHVDFNIFEEFQLFVFEWGLSDPGL